MEARASVNDGVASCVAVASAASVAAPTVVPTEFNETSPAVGGSGVVDGQFTGAVTGDVTSVALANLPAVNASGTQSDTASSLADSFPSGSPGGGGGSAEMQSGGATASTDSGLSRSAVGKPAPQPTIEVEVTPRRPTHERREGEKAAKKQRRDRPNDNSEPQPLPIEQPRSVGKEGAVVELPIKKEKARLDVTKFPQQLSACLDERGALRKGTMHIIVNNMALLHDASARVPVLIAIKRTSQTPEMMREFVELGGVGRMLTWMETAIVKPVGAETLLLEAFKVLRLLPLRALPKLSRQRLVEVTRQLRSRIKAAGLKAKDLLEAPEPGETASGGATDPQSEAKLGRLARAFQKAEGEAPAAKWAGSADQSASAPVRIAAIDASMEKHMVSVGSIGNAGRTSRSGQAPLSSRQSANASNVSAVPRAKARPKSSGPTMSASRVKEEAARTAARIRSAPPAEDASREWGASLRQEKATAAGSSPTSQADNAHITSTETPQPPQPSTCDVAAAAQKWWESEVPPDDAAPRVSALDFSRWSRSRSQTGFGDTVNDIGFQEGDGKLGAPVAPGIAPAPVQAASAPSASTSGTPVVGTRHAPRRPHVTRSGSGVKVDAASEALDVSLGENVARASELPLRPKQPAAPLSEPASRQGATGGEGVAVAESAGGTLPTPSSTEAPKAAVPSTGVLVQLFPVADSLVAMQKFLNPQNRTVSFGKGRTAEIVVNNELVSREHCYLELTENENIVSLIDCSTNGTFINGKQVLRKRANVKHGDKLLLRDPACTGNVEFGYMIGILQDEELTREMTRQQKAMETAAAEAAAAEAAAAITLSKVAAADPKVPKNVSVPAVSVQLAEEGGSTSADFAAPVASQAEGQQTIEQNQTMVDSTQDIPEKQGEPQSGDAQSHDAAVDAAAVVGNTSMLDDYEDGSRETLAQQMATPKAGGFNNQSVKVANMGCANVGVSDANDANNISGAACVEGADNGGLGGQGELSYEDGRVLDAHVEAQATFDVRFMSDTQAFSNPAEAATDANASWDVQGGRDGQMDFNTESASDAQFDAQAESGIQACSDAQSGSDAYVAVVGEDYVAAVGDDSETSSLPPPVPQAALFRLAPKSKNPVGAFGGPRPPKHPPPAPLIAGANQAGSKPGPPKALPSRVRRPTLPSERLLKAAGSKASALPKVPPVPPKPTQKAHSNAGMMPKAAAAAPTVVPPRREKQAIDVMPADVGNDTIPSQPQVKDAKKEDETDVVVSDDEVEVEVEDEEDVAQTLEDKAPVMQPRSKQNPAVTRPSLPFPKTVLSFQNFGKGSPSIDTPTTSETTHSGLVSEACRDTVQTSSQHFHPNSINDEAVDDPIPARKDDRPEESEKRVVESESVTMMEGDPQQSDVRTTTITATHQEGVSMNAACDMGVVPEVATEGHGLLSSTGPSSIQNVAVSFMSETTPEVFLNGDDTRPVQAARSKGSSLAARQIDSGVMPKPPAIVAHSVAPHSLDGVNSGFSPTGPPPPLPPRPEGQAFNAQVPTKAPPVAPMPAQLCGDMLGPPPLSTQPVQSAMTFLNENPWPPTSGIFASNWRPPIDVRPPINEFQPMINASDFLMPLPTMNIDSGGLPLLGVQQRPIGTPASVVPQLSPPLTGSSFGCTFGTGELPGSSNSALPFGGPHLSTPALPMAPPSVSSNATTPFILQMQTALSHLSPGTETALPLPSEPITDPNQGQAGMKTATLNRPGFGVAPMSMGMGQATFPPQPPLAAVPQCAGGLPGILTKRQDSPLEIPTIAPPCGQMPVGPHETRQAALPEPTTIPLRVHLGAGDPSQSGAQEASMSGNSPQGRGDFQHGEEGSSVTHAKAAELVPSVSSGNGSRAAGEIAQDTNERVRAFESMAEGAESYDETSGSSTDQDEADRSAKRRRDRKRRKSSAEFDRVRSVGPPGDTQASVGDERIVEDGLQDTANNKGNRDQQSRPSVDNESVEDDHDPAVDGEESDTEGSECDADGSNAGSAMAKRRSRKQPDDSMLENVLDDLAAWTSVVLGEDIEFVDDELTAGHTSLNTPAATNQAVAKNDLSPVSSSAGTCYSDDTESESGTTTPPMHPDVLAAALKKAAEDFGKRKATESQTSGEADKRDETTQSGEGGLEGKTKEAMDRKRQASGMTVASAGRERVARQAVLPEKPALLVDASAESPADPRLATQIPSDKKPVPSRSGLPLPSGQQLHALKQPSPQKQLHASKQPSPLKQEARHVKQPASPSKPQSHQSTRHHSHLKRSEAVGKQPSSHATHTKLNQKFARSASVRRKQEIEQDDDHGDSESYDDEVDKAREKELIRRAAALAAAEGRARRVRAAPPMTTSHAAQRLQPKREELPDGRSQSSRTPVVEKRKASSADSNWLSQATAEWAYNELVVSDGAETVDPEDALPNASTATGRSADAPPRASTVPLAAAASSGLAPQAASTGKKSVGRTSSQASVGAMETTNRSSAPSELDVALAHFEQLEPSARAPRHPRQCREPPRDACN
eukprot:TRINITY_DN21752_c0_g2_i1.p1 TRINITY_DN21752_c0_g2~~TRINITY_DN21752_c0_g2_i1.p1  ORF type:complete len:2623 (-),score=512.65 TRINITY_DN21752_c0_g2_i1:197-7696(-)